MREYLKRSWELKKVLKLLFMCLIILHLAFTDPDLFPMSSSLKLMLRLTDCLLRSSILDGQLLWFLCSNRMVIQMDDQSKKYFTVECLHSTDYHLVYPQLQQYSREPWRGFSREYPMLLCIWMISWLPGQPEKCTSGPWMRC